MSSFEKGGEAKLSYEEVFAHADRVAKEMRDQLESPDPRYDKPQVLDVKCDPETGTYVFSISRDIDKLPVEGSNVQYSVWKGKVGSDAPPERIFADNGWPLKGEDPGVDLSDIENGSVRVQTRHGEKTFQL